ncbi:MAG: TrkA C-terminal domain-containing protein, partial [Methanobacteriota archaeon]
RIKRESPLVGISLSDSQLRSRYQVSVVAIRRGRQMIISPGGEEVIQDSDILMIIGKPDDIMSAFPLSGESG